MTRFDTTRSAIYHGDSIKLLASAPAGFARLVFADPPFNIGYRYHGYDDARRYDDYVEWSRRWVKAAVRALAPDGSLYIAIGDDYAAELRIIGRKLGLTLRNWIIWHYQFGVSTREKFARAHAHILYFVRNAKDFVFNDEQVRFPSSRHTEYGDRRANPDGRVPDDVWTEFPRVCGTFREREGWHGCQMPEALLSRIIRVSSDPGDVVLDPFIGSGTTTAAAVKLSRIGIGIDQSDEYVAAARARLARAEEQAVEMRKPDASGWSEFDRECLRQVYRETETPVESLVANAAAMDCVARAIATRVGRRFATAEIEAELRRQFAKNLLPRFKNDRPWQPRRHRTAAHAPDRKLCASWFGSGADKLRRRNENARRTG
jgi:DNA modification methylase